MAHAISSTKPTAPSRTISTGRVSPTIASCSGSTVMLCFAFEFGYFRASRAAIAFTSVRARSTVTPGFMRPIT